jgi:hypothetical protein
MSGQDFPYEITTYDLPALGGDYQMAYTSAATGGVLYYDYRKSKVAYQPLDDVVTNVLQEGRPRPVDRGHDGLIVSTSTEQDLIHTIYYISDDAPTAPVELLTNLSNPASVVGTLPGYTILYTDGEYYATDGESVTRLFTSWDSLPTQATNERIEVERLVIEVIGRFVVTDGTPAGTYLLNPTQSDIEDYHVSGDDIFFFGPSGLFINRDRGAGGVEQLADPGTESVDYFGPRKSGDTITFIQVDRRSSSLVRIDPDGDRTELPLLPSGARVDLGYWRKIETVGPYYIIPALREDNTEVYIIDKQRETAWLVADFFSSEDIERGWNFTVALQDDRLLLQPWELNNDQPATYLFDGDAETKTLQFLGNGSINRLLHESGTHVYFHDQHTIRQFEKATNTLSILTDEFEHKPQLGSGKRLEDQPVQTSIVYDGMIFFAAARGGRCGFWTARLDNGATEFIPLAGDTPDNGVQHFLIVDGQLHFTFHTAAGTTQLYRTGGSTETTQAVQLLMTREEGIELLSLVGSEDSLWVFAEHQIYSLRGNQLGDSRAQTVPVIEANEQAGTFGGSGILDGGDHLYLPSTHERISYRVVFGSPWERYSQIVRIGDVVYRQRTMQFASSDNFDLLRIDPRTGVTTVIERKQQHTFVQPTLVGNGKGELFYPWEGVGAFGFTKPFLAKGHMSDTGWVHTPILENQTLESKLIQLGNKTYFSARDFSSISSLYTLSHENGTLAEPIPISSRERVRAAINYQGQDLVLTNRQLYAAPDMTSVLGMEEDLYLVSMSLAGDVVFITGVLNQQLVYRVYRSAEESGEWLPIGYLAQQPESAEQHLEAISDKVLIATSIQNAQIKYLLYDAAADSLYHLPSDANSWADIPVARTIAQHRGSFYFMRSVTENERRLASFDPVPTVVIRGVSLRRLERGRRAAKRGGWSW